MDEIDLQDEIEIIDPRTGERKRTTIEALIENLVDYIVVQVNDRLDLYEHEGTEH